MDISIQKATSEHEEQIIDLLKDRAKWLKVNNINQWGYLATGGEDEEIREAISNGDTYIALNNEEIIGTFTLYSKPSEWDVHIWGDASNSGIYLHRLAVRGDLKGRSLGVHMLAWIESNISGTLRLDCVAGNERLNQYYVDRGFNLLETVDDHNKYEKNLGE